MTTALPRFTVLICNYNYASFVARAIQSALAQDYPAELLQVVVVDDGSTDGSLAVYPAFAGDARFVLLTQPNRGQSAAFEAGVLAATGDYVCLLDSDDYFLPGKLRRLAQHIATLGEAPQRLFLCHDLLVGDGPQGAPRLDAPRWFEWVGVDGLPDRLTPADPVRHFPFAIPCGLVFSRAVLAACLAALPTWAFTRGADGILCPAALLMTGRAHYLREPLGVYCIHGANEFASLVDGRYVPRRNPALRAPRTLQFLEHWLDVLDLPGDERAVGLDYLRRLEHLGRRPSASRRLQEPQVHVVALAHAGDGPDAARRAEASAAESLQSHPATSFATLTPPAGTPQLQAIAAAWRDTTADHLVVLRAGDRLDRTSVERHLYWRQHGALVGLSCSDVRLVDRQGALLHQDVMRNSGAWKPPVQQVPPLATKLADWIAPPMSACMLRRTALLEALLAQADALPPALQEAGFWLLVQLQHHTGGALRIVETLATCTVPDGAAASYAYLSTPAGPDGALAAPPVREAAQWLADFQSREAALFARWLPAAWHRRFADWLRAQAG